MKKKQQAGFTLVEVLVALVITGMVTAFLSPVFAAQVQQNTASEVRSGAIEATQRRIDEMRLLDPSMMANTGSQTTSYNTNGRTFDVATTFCATSSYCSPVTRHLRLRTSYRNKVVYETETVLTQLR